MACLSGIRWVAVLAEPPWSALCAKRAPAAQFVALFVQALLLELGCGERLGSIREEAQTQVAAFAGS
jgi:hypothetical protein